MVWIRNPWWDGFWVLSGLPIGLLLLCMPSDALLVFFIVAGVLDTAHVLSPIVLAWSCRDLRQRVLLARPWSTIVLPTAVFAIAAAVGVMTSLGWSSLVYGKGNLWHITDWRNPFPVVVWTYYLWNIYHFGMQNYGVLRLYRRNSPLRHWQRREDDMTLCVGLTAFGMTALPMIAHSPNEFLISFGIISLNHSLVSLGLCSAVSGRRWLFLLGILFLGISIAVLVRYAVLWLDPSILTNGFVFAWYVATPHGLMIIIIPVIICARYGLGIVHFWYDRFLWRFSDPTVRGIIGCRLIPA